MTAKQLVICDLDNTLIQTDILVEQVRKMAAEAPLSMLMLPLWLARGRPFLKLRLAAAVKLDVARLPMRRGVIQKLEEYKAAGAHVVLLSATTDEVVQAIAGMLGIFDEAFGSTASANLKGKSKLRFILERFPRREFVYLGDSRADLAIWRHCRNMVAVNPSPSLERELLSIGGTLEILRDIDHARSG